MANNKSAQVLFELITHNTIQNQFFHMCMIFIDYYSVLIASLECLPKIQKYAGSEDADIMLNFFDVIFPYRIIEGGIDNILVIVFTALIVFFLFFYYFFIFLLDFSLNKDQTAGSFEQKKSNCIICLGKLYVNFYDILFMRYLSGYILYFLSNMVIYYLYIPEPTTISSIILIGYVVLLITYTASCYNHINTYFIIIQISNESISKDKGKYVFDIVYSKPFDNLVLMVKLIAGIEYSYTKVNDVVDYLAITLQLITLGFVVLISLKFSFQVTSFKKLDFYIFNKNLNLTRMVVTVFNVYFCLVTTFFISKDTSVLILILLFVFSCIWAFFTILLIWLVIIKPRFFDGEITLQKLLYIMVQSKKEATAILSGGESFFNVNIIKIQDAVEFQHRINCVEFSKCNLCKKYTNKEPVTVFDLYKHIVKMNGDSIIRNEVDILYRDLIKLFYYHINKEIFKFYSWYRRIYIKFDKVDKTIVNNLSYLISLCLSYYETYGLVTFSEVFQFTSINQMIESHLSNIKDFITCANELKYVDKFFKLSKDIRKLRNYMLYILQHVELKDDYNSNADNFTKNVKNIYRYNLFINRYIVETLTNRQFKELNQLNIEMFDEYLTSHYTQDKLLMINLDMNHQGQHNDKGMVSNNSYNILKCGKELITYRDKTFVDMLPKRLKKHGLEYFVKKLSKYIDYDTLEGYVKERETEQQKEDKKNGVLDRDSNGKGIDNSSLFQYVINETFDSNEISLLNYNFKVSRSLVDEHLLIYGYYMPMNNKIMMFEMNKLTDSNNVKDGVNMKLVNFSSGIKNIIMLRSEWLDILDKSNEHIYFSNLFKNYTQLKDSSGYAYEGILDYRKYSKDLRHYTKIIGEYLDNEIHNNINNDAESNKKLKESIGKNLKKIVEKSGKVVKMRFKSLFEIVLATRTYKIFSVYLQAKNVKQQGSFVEGKDMTNWNNNNEAVSEEAPSVSSYAQNTYNASNTSMTENSISARLSQKSRSHKEIKFSNAINNQNNKLDTISKTFATFSILIALLNVLIIMLCIIFLIVQIAKTNTLNSVNNLNYEFKRIRIAFAHSFLSVFTNGCLGHQGEKTCQSYYDTYSLELIKNYSYPDNLNVRDYLVSEIKYKINDMQSTFYLYKEDLFSYDDDNLLTTLSDTMTYTSFEQKNDELIQQSLSVTLEEGFRKIINAFTVLVNSVPNFSAVPIYIISFRESTVDFSNMEDKNLNEVQTQMYLILINYINYSLIFMNSENSLESEYKRVISSSTSVLIIFMVLIAFFNFILLVLCIWNISIVSRLFLNFITGMIMVMSDADFKMFYALRINDLITLSRLYVRNPNSLLQNIKKDEGKIAKKLRENNRKLLNEQHNQSQTEKDALLKAAEINKEKMKNIYVDMTKIQVIIFPFFVRVIILFTFYFIVCVAFDVVIFQQYNNMFVINDYILNNFLVETQIYDILVLTQLMTLLNLTQNDFAQSLGIDNPDSDGVINMKIRETATYLTEINKEQANSNSAFEIISDFFNQQNCSYIFRNVENELTTNTSQEKGIDYFELQSLLCEKFEILSLDSFEYMFNDYLLRVQKIQNLIYSYEYEDLYAFNTQIEFYDLTTMILLNMQPIRNYIRTVLMDELMNTTISDYIVLIVVYLCINILLDLCMFLIIKSKISGKLDEMHRDLMMFNDCFNM